MISLFIASGIGLIFVIAGILLLLRKSGKKSTSKRGILAERLEVEKLKSDIILNSIEDGVVLADKQQVIQVFNPSAARMTSWPATEAVNLDYRAVLRLIDEKGVAYPDDKHPFALAVSQGKSIRDNRAILVGKNNEHISVNISASPLFDENKQVSGVVGIFRDVSQERQEEQKRADFISTASHEMRTPVAAIEGYLALAMNDKVSKIDDNARQYLAKAHSSTQHLGELFQDLLTSAKAEDGRLINHPEVVELGQFLEQLSEDLKFVAQKKGLALELVRGVPGDKQPSNFKVVQPLYYVKVDPNRLREVMTNLFDNAVKYTPAGKITLGITSNEKIVQLLVKDTGNGIPAEDIPHLFQKFYRVDNSSTRTIGGTGLGLFICRKIIELYNGHIWVESEVNKGSTFYINLPRLSIQQVEAMKNEIQPNQNTTAISPPAPPQATKQPST